MAQTAGRLAWAAPEGCPSEADVEAKLTRLVGDAHLDAARAEITPADARFRLVVRVGSGTEERQRELVASTCEIATNAAVLFLAMSVAPNARLVPFVPEPELSPFGLEPPPPPPAPPAPPRFALGPLAALDVGALPSPAVSLGGGVAWRAHRWLRVELDGDYSFSQTTTLASGVGGDFSLLGLGGRACVPLFGPAFDLAPCVGARVTDVSGTGVGVTGQRTQSAWGWGPEAALVARVRLVGPLGLRVATLADIPLSRRPFVVDQAGVVARQSVVDFRAAIGPEVLF
jgi:hypothetical protein